MALVTLVPRYIRKGKDSGFQLVSSGVTFMRNGEMFKNVENMTKRPHPRTALLNVF
jgi:hypothetical protein